MMWGTDSHQLVPAQTHDWFCQACRLGWTESLFRSGHLKFFSAMVDADPRFWKKYLTTPRKKR